MTTKNCANGPKLVLKDLFEKSFVQNVLYSEKLFFMYINHMNSEYFLQSLLTSSLFFLTVNRRVQYLLIKFIVGGSLSEGNAKRRNNL